MALFLIRWTMIWGLVFSGALFRDGHTWWALGAGLIGVVSGVVFESYIEWKAVEENELKWLNRFMEGIPRE